MVGQPFVLVVDDEPDFCEIFSTKLSSMGFRVEIAQNGQMALDKMASAVPDIVLMDVRMPVMDGPTTLLKMRENPKLKDVKVVFLTNLGDPQFEVQEINRKFSADFGAQGYFKKTDDLTVVGDKIKELLQRPIATAS